MSSKYKSSGDEKRVRKPSADDDDGRTKGVVRLSDVARKKLIQERVEIVANRVQSEDEAEPEHQHPKRHNNATS